MKKAEQTFSSGTKRRRSASIARRLNAELAWKRFFRGLIPLFLAAALIFVGACLYVEYRYGGHVANVYDREFSGIWDPIKDFDIPAIADDFLYDMNVAYRDIRYIFAYHDGMLYTTPGYSYHAPFHNITYSFHVYESPSLKLTGLKLPDGYSMVVTESGETVVYVDANLTTLCNVLWYVTFFILILMFLRALLASLLGSGTIRKYLKPLDEIAMMAEKLSAERHTTSSEDVRQSAAQSAHDLGEVIHSIDSIDDSAGHIEVHAAEFMGLEAALNNMLKRLEDGKRKQIRFVDDASHELRTPISVIQGYAELLSRWGKEDETVRDEAIAAIRSEADHMKTLIDQLLFLARGEMDRHVLEKVPLSVDGMLMEILEESEMLDPSHEYRLQLPAAPEPSDASDASDASERVVLADPAMLKQAVRILRDNAVKYTPSGGTITLRAEERVKSSSASPKSASAPCREVVIEVSDTGSGIPADELPYIFDRFYRCQSVRSDNASGSGLGLSIARWIITEHSGSIEAISSVGIGTKMRIVLSAVGNEGDAAS